MKVLITNNAGDTKEISLFQARVMLGEQSKKDKAVYKNDPEEWFNYYGELKAKGEIFFEGWMQFNLIQN